VRGKKKEESPLLDLTTKGEPKSSSLALLGEEVNRSEWVGKPSAGGVVDTPEKKKWRRAIYV